MDYKRAPKIPATLKIGLMFSPFRKCSDMEGSGTLKVVVKEARNLSSLSRATNLYREWACSNLLPYQCLTSETTPKKMGKVITLLGNTPSRMRGGR